MNKVIMLNDWLLILIINWSWVIIKRNVLCMRRWLRMWILLLVLELERHRSLDLIQNFCHNFIFVWRLRFMVFFIHFPC